MLRLLGELIQRRLRAQSKTIRIKRYRKEPSATEPQPKDEKIFNHKERKDHKKEWRAGFPTRLG
jgi:hypothetical protein